MGLNQTKEKQRGPTCPLPSLSAVPKQEIFYDSGVIHWDIVEKFIEIQKSHQPNFGIRVERKEKDQDFNDIPLVAQRGIKITYVVSWWSELIERKPELKESATREIVNEIRFLTSSSGSCLWDLFPSSERGYPDCAISHSWDYQFSFLLDVILKGQNMGPRELSNVEFIWLDIFALTQHSDGSSKQAEEISQLGKIFGHYCPFVVQVLPRSEFLFRGKFSRAEFLGALNRAWCIFEFVQASTSGARFTFLSPNDCNLDYQNPLSLIRYWSPHLSESLYVEDKNNIDQLVLTTFQTWNTLKAVALMIFLKLNNCGPVFDRAVRNGLCESHYPWNKIFPGSVEEIMIHHPSAGTVTTRNNFQRSLNEIEWEKFLKYYFKYY
jgi:hypothetical protein